MMEKQPASKGAAYTYDIIQVTGLDKYIGKYRKGQQRREDIFIP